MAQSVTESLTNSACDNRSMSVKSHCFAFGSVVVAIFCVNSSSMSDQVQRDMVHSRRECLQESGAPHMPHRLESAICLRARTSLVGIECFDSLHKNILTFPGTCIFHKLFQDLSSPAILDEPDVFSSYASFLGLVTTSMR